MLKTKELIEGIDEKYHSMLKKVNIADFTKCIAELSGLTLDEIDDKVIKKYLHTWAKNKFRFYVMLNSQLRADSSITYTKTEDDVETKIEDLKRDFPVYSLWLDQFTGQKANKITNLYRYNYGFINIVRQIFPSFKLEGSTITHFFSKCLEAPDELITKIGRLFENSTIEGYYTISIDPVDMMLASESPYDWESCYRLETYNCSSHADGCLASVLDSSSVITYIWTKEGKFILNDEYEFKSIRYKKIREWIAISPNMSAVHFNAIYPLRDNATNEFKKLLREKVETAIANYLLVDNKWRKSENCRIDRSYLYGYGEFFESNIYELEDNEDEEIEVYDEPFECACGCGETINGSDEGLEYLGEGFQHDCYMNSCYCEYCEDTCPQHNSECCEEDCFDCEYWKNNHPVCELSPYDECLNPDIECTYNGKMISNKANCEGCEYWELHFSKDED